MWTFPVHQEQREMAAMQLGKELFFFNLFLPFFYPFSLVSFCTTVSAKMSFLMYCCLIYKLILLSSESENGKVGTCHRSTLWNTLETSIYWNNRCSDNHSLLLPVATPRYSCLFFFPPFGSLHADLFLPCFQICLLLEDFSISMASLYN